MEAEGDHPRMAIVDMGGGSALNVFEVPAESIVGDPTKMGGRGPIDHYALAVESEERLHEIRDHLVSVGASPGDVTQFGPAMFSVFFEILMAPNWKLRISRPVTRSVVSLTVA